MKTLLLPVLLGSSVYSPKSRIQAEWVDSGSTGAGRQSEFTESSGCCLILMVPPARCEDSKISWERLSSRAAESSVLVSTQIKLDLTKEEKTLCERRPCSSVLFSSAWFPNQPHLWITDTAHQSVVKNWAILWLNNRNSTISWIIHGLIQSTRFSAH